MAKQNDSSSAMEIDHNPNSSDETNSPRFSINVLELFKSAQKQHGLRNSDYTRYRRYCTARLRRLYKSLKLTHGRGKYNKKAITAPMVTDVRYLHVILYTAERAWSHAMEKKTLPDGPTARQRSYLIGRLRKAVKWATLFQELCAIKGDSRTSFEAEAYASFMRGTLLFEQEQNWEVALKSFKNASAVYVELGKYGDEEIRHLCNDRVAEIEPNIRYCIHKIRGSNLQISEFENLGEMEGPALDMFRAKMEAVKSEARSQRAASMKELNWLGHTFSVPNAKARVAILKAQELEKDIHGPKADSTPADKRVNIYSKIVSSYEEAKNLIHSDLVTAGNSDNVKDNLSGLYKAISAIIGQLNIERYELMVNTAISKLSKVDGDRNEKVSKPEEVVHLYSMLLLVTAELSDLVSSGRDRKPEEVAVAEDCDRKSLVFKAARCFYLAKSYSLAGKRTEAYALYCRSRSLADAALQSLRSVKSPDQVMMKELQRLYNESRSNSCIEHALAVMEEEEAPEKLSKKISAVSLNGAKKPEKFLLENLDVYESAVDSSVKSMARIERFPPAFQAFARNPVVLDIVYDTIDFPSLESRTKKDRKGFLGRLWR
ncbi:OLC1v1014407C1 [Oldenlandia corymbosa var. corymbosa]|uniref:Signal recognition particle subunit SRP68 n=1 Tax=Oldenlandia corymbosa var. corymbosa TaxID=529605 RepID=A0AAV1E0Z4_OLDCO|nr:OLC1v1014407C1 [Oldenlandia corymbosa var. corymbosa]